MSASDSRDQPRDASAGPGLRPQATPAVSQYSHWDYYAAKVQPRDDFWPGDEWGSEATWDLLFRRLFEPSGVSGWRRCVEIGAGSGKYSLKTLRASSAELIAADISAGYQSHFRARMEQEGLAHRVTPVLIDNDSGALLRHIAARNWVGEVDALYSIDAMVHVDLQYLIAYLVTAAHVMREGGKLIMTVANACSRLGFEKLVADARRMFQRMHTHSAKFEWMSPDQVQFLLSKLAFEIDIMDTGGRDILFAATLKRRLEDESILKCIK